MKKYLMSRPMFDADGGGGSGGGGTAGGEGSGGDAGASGNGTGADKESSGGGDAPEDVKTDPPANAPSIDEIMKQVEARFKAAAEEAEKKAGMKPDEKEAYEKAKRIEEFEKREKDIALRELRAETAEMLAAKKLPPEVLDIVLGADKAATEKNIAAFNKMFDAAVQKQVETRLAGKTPPAGNVNADTAPTTLAGALAEHYGLKR